jgi:hypothetical protein
VAIKQEIQEQILIAEARGVDAYRGMDWCNLSDAEALQFGIDRAEFSGLLVAWQCYLAFCGIIGAEDAGLEPETVTAERTRFPQFFEGQVVSGKAFSSLAGEWCGIAPEKAQAMYDKVAAWDRRDAAMEDE